MLDLSALTLRSVRAAQRMAEFLPASWYAFLRQRWHRIRPALPARLASRRFDGIPGRIHVADYMHRGVAHVAAAGQDAVRSMDESLLAAGRSWADVRRLLDYGCGYGRVLRWITGRGFEIVGADVNAQAVTFCADEFGTTPFVIPLGREDWELPGHHDLIWVGSVFTHLTREGCIRSLARLVKALSPRGVLVFTTHGELAGSGAQYGKDVAREAERIRATLAAGDVAFVASREDAAWGQTFHARSAVRATITELGMQLVREAPRGWDNHQDVWTVVHSSGGAR